MMKNRTGRTVQRATLVLTALFFSSALLAACAAQKPLGVTPVMRVAQTFVEPAVIQHLDVLHSRLQGHATLPTQEYSVCLRGLVTPDTTLITQLSAARIDASGPQGVDAWCAHEPGFIGIAHNHPTGSIRCATSVADLFLFLEQRTEVALHTCDEDERPDTTIYIIRRRGNYAPVILLYNRVEGSMHRVGPRT